MSDSISLKQRLSPDAWHALEGFAGRRDYEWFQPVIEPQWAAWLIEILKQCDDNEALFPRGKWATIQVIQGIVAARASAERFTLKAMQP